MTSGAFITRGSSPQELGFAASAIQPKGVTNVPRNSTSGRHAIRRCSRCSAMWGGVARKP